MPGQGRRGVPGQKPKDAKKTLKRILTYMGKSKLLLFVVFLSLVMATVCQMAASYWLKPILDDVASSIQAGNFATEGIKQLIKNLVIVSAFYIGASLFIFIQSKIMVKIAYRTSNIIRKDLFDHLQTLPLRYFDSQTHGEIMSRFTNDVDNIQMMLEQSIVQLVSSVFSFIGIIIMMIVLEWRLFIVALVFLIIMIVNSMNIAKHTRKYFKAQQKALGEMNGNIEETIEGMKVVKVFNHEEQAKEDFEELNENFRQVATKANYYSGIMGPCSTGINNASYASVTLAGGLLVLTKGLSIGTFFTFLSYSKQFTQPINQIMNQMNNVFSALAGAERVFAVMDTESEVDDGTVTLEETATENGKVWNWVDGDKKIPVKGEVVFKDVTFGYVEDKVVLHDINLYAKQAQKNCVCRLNRCRQNHNHKSHQQILRYSGRYNYLRRNRHQAN